MLADFDAGNIDITDVPDLTPRLDCVANPGATPPGAAPAGCDQNNANYYVSNAQVELGEQQLDISHQASFLGVALQCSRYTLPAAGAAGDTACSPSWRPQTPAISINVDTATACDATHFDLTIHLKNWEENLALITDPNEVITVGPISLSSATGTYDLGCLSGIAPGYTVTTAVYGDAAVPVSNSARVTIATSFGGTGPLCANNKLCDVDFKVDYKSSSTKNPTVASVYISRALGHLIEKSSFVNELAVKPAFCDDIKASPGGLSWGVVSPDHDTPTTKRSCADDSPLSRAACAIGLVWCTSGFSWGVEVDSPTIQAESTLLSLAAGATYATDVSSGTLPAGWSAIPGCASHLSLFNCGNTGVPYDIGASPVAACPVPVYTGVGRCFPSRGSTGSLTILSTTGYSGSADIVAACDYLLLAGFTLSGGNCADLAMGAGNHVSNGQVVSGAACTPVPTSPATDCQIYLYIRDQAQFRALPRFGQIFADELEFLFGTSSTGGTICYGGTFSGPPRPGAGCSVPPTAVTYYSLGAASDIIFEAQNTWNLYTGQQDHSGSGTPDSSIYPFHSSFASASCGGPSAAFPSNYDEYCDPIVDTQANAGEFSPMLGSPDISATVPPLGTPSGSFRFFLNAATDASTRGAVIPVLSQFNQYVASNAYNTEPVPGYPSSLVTGLGNIFGAGGDGAYFSLLNMQALVSCAAPYCALPGTIRRSSTSGPGGVLHQNPFTSRTAWETDITRGIWDSMLMPNPNTAGASSSFASLAPLQLIDWMTKSHSSSFDPATGRNTQVWNLHNDICFQDSSINPVGQPCDRPVTADDVCFSILMQRDGPGVGFIAAQDVVSCTYPDSQTVVVVHSGLSAFQDINIGGIYILPAHLWGTACGWASGIHDSNHEPKTPYAAGVGVIGAPCVLSGFDPMALTFNGAPFPTPLPPNVSGLMVGSGPYMCVVPAHTGPGPAQGQIGGSCAESPATGALQGQALAVGFVQLETKFPFYMRCCDATQGSPLQPLSWADSTNIGKVTIVAASSLSFVFGANDPYWGDPLYGPPGMVGIGDAAFLASEFDIGTIAPCVAFQCPGPPTELNPAAALLFPDPLLDPYQANLGLGNSVYYLGLRSGTLYLAILTGAPAPTSFTATLGGTIVVGAPGPVAGQIVFPGLGSPPPHILTVKYLGNAIFKMNV